MNPRPNLMKDPTPALAQTTIYRNSYNVPTWKKIKLKILMIKEVS